MALLAKTCISTGWRGKILLTGHYTRVINVDFLEIAQLQAKMFKDINSCTMCTHL